MLTTIISAAIISNAHDPVLNLETASPKQAHSAISDVAKMVGYDLYAPNEIARGYTLRSITLADIPTSTSFSGLKERKAVRMTFVNSKTSAAFDIVQSKTNKSTNSATHMKWIINRGSFEMAITKHHTVVYQKFGNNDVAFVGTLISEPSAKILLSQCKKIQ